MGEEGAGSVLALIEVWFLAQLPSPPVVTVALGAGVSHVGYSGCKCSEWQELVFKTGFQFMANKQFRMEFFFGNISLR